VKPNSALLPHRSEDPQRPSSRAAFELRCWSRARLYVEGELELREAVDALQLGAAASGLVDELSQDEVQRILSLAFAGVTRGGQR
jgi:hypothetical protein